MDEQDKRLERIESKVDRMSEAIVSLARMEERMITLFKRMDSYDDKQKTLEVRLSDIEVKHASIAWIERLVWIIIGAVVSAAIYLGK
jgi:hypothetical protein